MNVNEILHVTKGQTIKKKKKKRFHYGVLGTDGLMRNSLFKTSCTMCVQQVNSETTRRCRPLPAVLSQAFEWCGGLTPHKATSSIKS